ncbi:bifunctional phosphoribosylaminoimidazolecarboxamide formyltransferase/IMP cyclohydrolase [Streptococcus pneumoniae]|nr:bifunctional phosphoribosylaminoimidazolecarboxamide formyltransferase/IMP cyclohydrolase [Streptococcus pneumoniae]
MTKRVLISVSDKAGIVEFAQELKKLGWEIISTGGTKVALDNAGVDTIAIDDVTGFPEMNDGRSCEDPPPKYPRRASRSS